MKNLWKEFKEFAFTGNVIDMAVGVILGGALKDVVTALVNMLMGIISGIIKIPASLDEAVFKMSIGPAGTVSVKYGAFVSSFINFLLCHSGDAADRRSLHPAVCCEGGGQRAAYDTSRRKCG